MKKLIIIVIGLLLSFQMLQANEERIVELKLGYNAVQFDGNVTLDEFKSKIGVEKLISIQGAGQGSTYKKEYEDNGTSFLNSFTQIEFGKAYWIKVISDVIFSYIPEVYEGTKNIDLVEGWNFVGPIDILSLSEIQEQLGIDNLLVIQGAGQGRTYKKEYVTEETPFLNNFMAFELGQGYWLKLESQASLSFEFDLEEIARKQAQAKIEAYANNSSNTKPTLQDYIDAGVVGVTTENLEAVNRTVENRTREEVDTLEELNVLVANPCITIEDLKLKVSNNEDVMQVNTGCITDMSNLLKDNKMFNQDIGTWDVSNVTNMKSMFNGAINFNQNLENWDVSNVTNMYAMFVGVRSINKDIIEYWDVSNITNMEHMFDSVTFYNKYTGVGSLSYSLHSSAYKTNANASPNSLGALKYCINKGIIFDGDIQLSRDNILVMSHNNPGYAKDHTTLDEILSYIKNDAPNTVIQLEAKHFDWNPSDIKDRDIIPILNRIKHYNLFNNIMLWSRSVEGAIFIREYLDSINVTNAHIGIWVFNKYTYDGDSHQRVRDLIMQVAENNYKYVDLVGLYASHGYPDGIRDLNQDIEIQMLFSDNSPPVNIINNYIEKGLTHVASNNPQEYLDTGLFE